MPAGTIPPWIQAGDPAAATAQGFQIGAKIGQDQARQAMEQEQQQFYEQEAIKQQQLAAQKEARAQAEFGLQAAESARKLDSQLKYQDAIRTGMDPLKALLQFGPGMTGQASAEAAAIRSQQMTTKAPSPWTVQDLGAGMSAAVNNQGGFHQLKPNPPAAAPLTQPVQSVPVLDPSGKPVPNTFAVPAAGGKGVTIHKASDDTGKISQADRDELRFLERDYDRLQKDIDKDESPLSPLANILTKDQKKLTPTQTAIIKAHDLKKAKLDALDAQIKAIRDRSRGGEEAAPAKASPKSKVARARELSAQHPNWTKEQVIAAVNQEFANAQSSP